MLSAILLKMATISWSEIVCCAMVEFQKELLDAYTRCKTGFGTKMLDPSSVAFYNFPSELSSPELYMPLRSTVQIETPYTVRQGITDRLGPDQSPSPRGLLTLMIKQQEKNLAADNEAIQAQQQLLRDLYRDQQSSQTTRHHAANRARPRPRSLKNTPKKVQQTCDLASIQAQLSELKKIFL